MGWAKGLLITGVLAFLVGCVAEPEPVAVQPDESQPVEVRSPLPSDGSFKTDGNTYTASCLGEDAERICTLTLAVTYMNQTAASVYLDYTTGANATPVYFVRGLTQAGSAYNPNWAGCCAERLEVLPGEVRRDTLMLSGPNGWDGVTGESIGDLEGRIQIIYDVFICPDEYSSRCLLPSEGGTSNVFAVVLPD